MSTRLDCFQPAAVPAIAPTERRLTLKRVLDVSVALLGIVLLSPLFLVLGLSARLSTHGSAIFRQQRLGLGGLPFMVAKFRTLSPSAPSDVHKADHLATRVGRVMRLVKFDELPQLWNILKGDMSLVGPRPIIPDEYRGSSHLDRLTIRPGLTGLWQVGQARSDRFDEHPEYDIFYLANRRMSFDLWLMWRTLMLIGAGREVELSRVIDRWERNPEWRTLTHASEVRGNRSEPERSDNAALGERAHPMGSHLLAGRIETLAASAPAE